jgi:Family of unknown function (DUF5677)
MEATVRGDRFVLQFLRESLNADTRSLAEIAKATAIDVADLRRFASGVSVLEGLDLDRLASLLGLELAPRLNANLLPLEREASRGIQRHFVQTFTDATMALALAFRVIGANSDGRGSLKNITKPRGLTWPVVNLCLGLHTKVIKHFRAVIALSELGLAQDANVATRAMFEATLALQFILSPRICLKEGGRPVTHTRGKKEQLCQKCKHVVRPGKPQQKLRKLSTVMRAKLYAAFPAINRERRSKEYITEKIGDLDKMQANLPRIGKEAAKARRMIGGAWAERQKEHKGFAGVSVRDLADTYKLLPYYLTIYRQQSDIVHGANAIDYFETDALDSSLRLNLGPNPDGIDTVLFIATALMVGAAEILNERLGLGFDAELKRTVRYLKAQGKAR